MLAIKKYRLRAGLTQEQLADKIGVSRATLPGWERSRGSIPDFITGLHICKALGITPYQLAGIPINVPTEAIESIKQTIDQILEDSKTKLKREAEKDMLNQVKLVGRLVEDPGHHRIDSTGSVSISFVIAVDRDYMGKSTKECGADFIEITACGWLADWCHNHLKKGRLICVSGCIHVPSHTNNHVIRKRGFEIIASDIYMK